MSVKTRFFHFSYYGFEATVIESQVIRPAQLLRAEGVSLHLVFMETFSVWLSHRRVNARAAGLPFTVLPRVPRNFLWLNSVMLGLVLLPGALRGDALVVHARGFQGTAVATALKRVFRRLRVLCDVRGVEVEEYRYAARSRSIFTLLARQVWLACLSRIQSRALRTADAVTAVSRALLVRLQSEMSPERDVPWAYVPCAVDTDLFTLARRKREEIRRRLGLDGRLVVIYSGSLSAWQVPGETLKIFRELKAIDASCFLLALTPEVERMNAFVAKAGLNPADVHVRRADFQDIAGYLACGDIGLLIREDNPVNKFSCPTKFAEYLASGFHVIATGAIADVADLLVHRPVGTIVDLKAIAAARAPALSKAIEESKAVDRRVKAATTAAKEIFDWSIYVPLLKERYLRLAQSAADA